ncbi:malto-oligosyltrehalose synthase [Segnochrobactrum spirostomi]|uniref:Malto-oligosyltrehalose synthase n=1 Tax=Segnochrobactrum spirostomi TaxID=2608987 RepID=A0A6A7Y124_9HYPH|nr:malto-oligosyltrehalose synthase [Segnochrobactrum spirostomi]MQT12087.1 malto-oligosyltrehalose synthase [Segnochrobactrum spirostomi]
MIPFRATARLQFHAGFTLDDALPLVDYYADLGISHLYASPLTTATAGSTHGYDVIDHGRINPELGGKPALERLVAALRARNMGLLLDIVPNHMGLPGNTWWEDVLTNGRDSRYATFFDIDWEAADPATRGKVLLPVLGRPYGEILENGELALEWDQAAGFRVRYHDRTFPIAPRDQEALVAGGSGPDAVAVAAVERIDVVSPAGDDIVVESALVQSTLVERPAGRSPDEIIALHAPDTAEGRRRLDALIARQNWRLAWWRIARDAINWRRFFEIDGLVGVRVEREEVFEAVHALTFDLYARGLIDGVRIDHVDGLADPRGYCRRLRQRLALLSDKRPAELGKGPAIILVEKILAADESLDEGWLVDGTTGYDFLDRVSGLLVDPAGEAPLTALWAEMRGATVSFEDEVLTARREVLTTSFVSEWEATARAITAVAALDPMTRDHTLPAIRRALGEIVVHFPVYRTYAGAAGFGPDDAAVLARALAGAKIGLGPADVEVAERIADILGRQAPQDFPPAERELRERAITRFQQLTSPIAAKSVEDTAFYRYGRLLARNDVGADPGRFSLDLAAFHALGADRAQHYPDALLATATHDHKRGEDARARLAVLSEVPEAFATALARWRNINADLRRDTKAGPAPDSVDEAMLYQTLIGLWPTGLAPADRHAIEALRARVEAWQLKALREAKRHTSWTDPNVDYEGGAGDFLARILARADFVTELADFVARIAPAGALNSLIQTALKMTTPGVPDLYQGTEFWDFSLVDPDNRRPVDFDARRDALAAGATPTELLAAWRDGRVKQAMIAALAGARTANPALWARGAYEPLMIEGAQAGRALAFARRLGREEAVVVMPLRAARLLAGDLPQVTAESWGDTALVLPATAGEAPLTDVLSGQVLPAAGRIPLASLLKDFPIAVLTTPAEGT